MAAHSSGDPPGVSAVQRFEYPKCAWSSGLPWRAREDSNLQPLDSKSNFHENSKVKSIPISLSFQTLYPCIAVHSHAHIIAPCRNYVETLRSNL